MLLYRSTYRFDVLISFWNPSGSNVALLEDGPQCVERGAFRGNRMKTSVQTVKLRQKNETDEGTQKSRHPGTSSQNALPVIVDGFVHHSTASLSRNAERTNRRRELAPPSPPPPPPASPSTHESVHTTRITHKSLTHTTRITHKSLTHNSFTDKLFTHSSLTQG